MLLRPTQVLRQNVKNYVSTTIVVVTSLLSTHCHSMLRGINRDPSSLQVGLTPQGSALGTHNGPRRPFQLIDVVYAQRRLVRETPKLAHRYRVIPTKANPEQGSPENSLEDALMFQVMADSDEVPRPFWDEVLNQAIPQLGLSGKTTANKILIDVRNKLDTDPKFKKSENQDLRHKILEDLKHLDANQNTNVLEHPEEATYVITDKALSQTQTLPLGIDGFTLDISPKDLLKSYAVTCKEDLCQVSVIKPVTLMGSIPLNLNANVDIVFTRSFDASSKNVSFDISIDGHFRPVNLANIVAVDLSAGFDMHYSPTTLAFKVDNTRCSATLNCNIPFVSFAAKISNKGISFAAGAAVEGLPGQLIKLIPGGGQVKKEFPFEEVTGSLMETLKKLPDPDGEVDIHWHEILSHIEDHHNAAPKPTNTGVIEAY